MPHTRPWETTRFCWLRLLWGLQPFLLGAEWMETVYGTAKGSSVSNYGQKRECKGILQTIFHHPVTEDRLSACSCVRLSESDLQLGQFLGSPAQHPAVGYSMTR